MRKSALGPFILALNQFFCGLLGHDQVLHFEDSRIRLHCLSCSHDSPGWDVGNQRPRQRFEGYAERHVLMRPAFAERKAA
jgi:hypothetical protein